MNTKKVILMILGFPVIGFIFGIYISYPVYIYMNLAYLSYWHLPLFMAWVAFGFIIYELCEHEWFGSV